MENQNEKPKGRSNPGTESSPNPAKIFVEWKSKNEKFSYYLKAEKKEDSKDVLLPMPFNFIPLFIASTVKGYNHKKTKTFISNEIENLSTDILTVYSYNSVTKEKKMEYSGLYSDIKDGFDQNIKFTSSIYAAVKDKKGVLSLINIQLNGAGLHHWFKFSKDNDIWKNAISAYGTTDERNGTVDYKAPTYKAIKISEEDDAKAGELQEEVKAYLKDYFAKNKGTKVEESENQNNGLNNNSKSEKKVETKSKEKIEEVTEPIFVADDSDEDAPFS